MTATHHRGLTEKVALYRPWALWMFILVALASVGFIVVFGGFLAWSLGGIVVGLGFLAWDLP